ncbi:hypothetical protein BJX99DRAFT_116300 [Aspergillus californicus]
MLSLFGLIDRVSDVVISVANTFRSSSPPARYTSPPPNSPNYNRYRPRGPEFNDPYYQRRDPSQRSDRLPYPETRAHARQAVDPLRSNPTPSADRNETQNQRFYRTPLNAAKVHWGHITEISAGHDPSAAGLTGYHQRQNRTVNYVYGAEANPSSHVGASGGSRSRNRKGKGKRNGSNSSSTSDSNSDSNSSSSDSDSDSDSPTRYSSLSEIPRVNETDTDHEDIDYAGKPKFRHRTQYPTRSILKPPTPIDDEILIRNLWAMVILADNRLNYSYEFLSGVILIGDDVLDAMMQMGELAMQEEATARAIAAIEVSRNWNAPSERSTPGSWPELPKMRAGEERRARRAKKARKARSPRVRADSPPVPVQNQAPPQAQTQQQRRSKGFSSEEVIVEEDEDEGQD